MKRPFKTILVLIISLLVLPTLLSAAQFKVTRVIDGDTIKAQSHDVEIRVILVGIDAPETSRKKSELGQPYSQSAKEYLAELILNKTVDIKFHGLDKYDRALGVIVLEGKNINLEMVRAGLAEAYRGRPASKFNPFPYLSAEEEAKEAKKGMWSLGDEYISPKEWRKMHRGR